MQIVCNGENSHEMSNLFFAKIGRSSLIRVYTIYYFTKYFKKQLHKMQNLGKNRVSNKVIEILGLYPYCM